MNPIIRLARPGYITGSAQGAFMVAVLEAVLGASLQYFKVRRAGRVMRRA
ncbi:MAG TPA: hypothetical protein VGM72_11915 [Micropepsaceae bacterium]|jgi:hypothetical protein